MNPTSSPLTHTTKVQSVVLRDHPQVLEQSKEYQSVSIQNKLLTSIPKGVLPNVFNGKEYWNNIMNPQQIGDPRDGLFYMVKECYTIRLNICSYRMFYVPDFSYVEMMIEMDTPPKIPNKNSISYSQQSSIYQGYSFYDPLEYIVQHGIVVDDCVSDTLLKDKGDITLQSITTEDQRKQVQTKYNTLLKRDVGCLYRYRQQLARRVFRIDGIVNVGLSTNSTQQNIVDIKTEIYSRGPVLAGMVMYSDMMDWDGFGIYYGPKNIDKTIGGIPLCIYGWGSDESTSIDYWLCMTPFGLDWGYFGKCKIRMGIDGCNLENNVVAFYPEMPNNGVRELFLSKGVVDRPKLVPGYFMSEDTLNMIRNTTLTGRFGTHDTSKLLLIPNADMTLLINLDKVKAANIMSYNYEQTFKDQEQGNLILFLFSINFLMFLYVYILRRK